MHYPTSTRMIENFFDNDLTLVTAITGKYHRLTTLDGYETMDSKTLIYYA
jgi:hypothetical protein